MPCPPMAPVQLLQVDLPVLLRQLVEVALELCALLHAEVQQAVLVRQVHPSSGACEPAPLQKGEWGVLWFPIINSYVKIPEGMVGYGSRLFIRNRGYYSED